jgi:ADP-heptose:LPS heptosyltransferase
MPASFAFARFFPGSTVLRITIVHQGALGDTLLLLPLVRSLRQRYHPSGGCAVHLVTRTNLGQMMTMMGLVEGYSSADDQDHSRWFSPPDSSGMPNSWPPWAADADLLLSAVSNGDDPWAANARLAVGPGAQILFFEPRPAPPPSTAQSAQARSPLEHVTQWHRRQLASLNLDEAPQPLPRNNPDGALLIHPGSGGDAKCWPRERFLTLGRTLKRNGLLPTFILGEAEQERWGHKVVDDLKEEFPWYLHMGLYELAERMSRGRVYLGNDSGVSHLAAAMGIPVIVLFGPSNDAQWRPIGPSVKVVRAPAPFEQSLEHLDHDTVLGELFAELRKL